MAEAARTDGGKQKACNRQRKEAVARRRIVIEAVKQNTAKDSQQDRQRPACTLAPEKSQAGQQGNQGGIAEGLVHDARVFKHIVENLARGIGQGGQVEAAPSQSKAEPIQVGIKLVRHQQKTAGVEPVEVENNRDSSQGAEGQAFSELGRSRRSFTPKGPVKEQKRPGKHQGIQGAVVEFADKHDSQ